MTAVDLIAETLRAHPVECTGPGEVTCRGCRDKGWMSWRDFYAHQAQAVTEALGLVEDLALIRTALISEINHDAAIEALFRLEALGGA
jgi:hypothetical protein